MSMKELRKELRLCIRDAYSVPGSCDFKEGMISGLKTSIKMLDTFIKE